MNRRGYQGPASRAVSNVAARALVRRIAMEEVEADVREFYEERAAIMEHVGNLPRSTAERHARERARLRRVLLVADLERVS